MLLTTTKMVVQEVSNVVKLLKINIRKKFYLKKERISSIFNDNYLIKIKQN